MNLLDPSAFSRNFPSPASATASGLPPFGGAAAVAAVVTDETGRNAGEDAGTKDEEASKDNNGDTVDDHAEGSARWIGYCPRSNYVFSNTTNQSSVMRGEAPELSTAHGVDDEAQDGPRRAQKLASPSSGLEAEAYSRRGMRPAS